MTARARNIVGFSAVPWMSLKVRVSFDGGGAAEAPMIGWMLCEDDEDGAYALPVVAVNHGIGEQGQEVVDFVDTIRPGTKLAGSQAGWSYQVLPVGAPAMDAIQYIANAMEQANLHLAELREILERRSM